MGFNLADVGTEEVAHWAFGLFAERMVGASVGLFLQIHYENFTNCQITFLQTFEGFSMILCEMKEEFKST